MEGLSDFEEVEDDKGKSDCEEEGKGDGDVEGLSDLRRRVRVMVMWRV